MARILNFTVATFLAAGVTCANADIPPPSMFHLVGSVSNNSNPATWQGAVVDVSALILGSVGASLSFDLINDTLGRSNVPNAPTYANVYFANSGGQYYMNFEWVGGNSTAHFRAVRLVYNGITYSDQFGAFNNHLGHPELGTAQDGFQDDGSNILGQTGFAARTYVLSPIPEPAIIWGLLLGLPLIFWRGRNKLLATKL